MVVVHLIIHATFFIQGVAGWCSRGSIGLSNTSSILGIESTRQPKGSVPTILHSFKSIICALYLREKGIRFYSKFIKVNARRSLCSCGSWSRTRSTCVTPTAYLVSSGTPTDPSIEHDFSISERNGQTSQ